MTDKLITRDGWRGWHLNPDTPYLVYLGDRHPGYRIDFDRLLTARDVLFWITQLHGKVWGADALDGFVQVLDELLDVQDTLASPRGVDFTPESIRRRVAEFVKESA